MDIKDIVNENIDQFRCFWLDWSNKVKYIDFFKRGLTSGEILGLFFIKDAKAILELTRYYKDFKKIVIYDVKGTINLLKDYDSIDEFNDPRVEYIYAGQDISMKFDKIIMNPPYSLGNKITEVVLSSLNDNGDCICLMPLSQYKKKELYRHVDTFDLADPKLFEDATVQENLSICLLKKNIVNKYDWMELTLKSFDQRFIEYYKWNIEHNKGIAPVRKDYKTPEMFDRNLDFVDTGRCFDATSHGHFSGPNSFGYKYNFYLKDWTNKDWGNILCVIHFQSKEAKDNFRTFAYADNYQNNLAAKCLSGIKTNMASSEYYFAIPQIDWENISNNPLWKAGNYDEAVLSEMGLKWQDDTIVKC